MASASFNGPTGVCSDTVGTLYFTTAYNIVLKVDALGIISAFAGTGAQGNSGNDGQATSAKLIDPRNCVLDTSSNVYLSEFSNNMIRVVTLSTKKISKYAGNQVSTSGGDGGRATSAGMTPQSIFMDTLGNMYFSSYQSYRVGKIAAATTIVTTFAGSGVNSVTGMGGLATAASISGISAYVVGDNMGNLFIGTSNRIFRVDGSSNFITQYAGQFYFVII
jgi:streptogramin lyase